ncbi:MAG: 4Fe-4S dicluster domain-containing protein [Myxococcota bacterium]|jgi:succinate dehydrogenase/fumarate reductase-like Fe-S protein
MDMGKTFIAIANLGVRFWIHIFKWPFISRKAIGIARFENNYRDDRLAMFDQVTADHMPVYHNCINCGSCDAACARARNFHMGLWSGEGPGETIERISPSLIPVNVSRSQPLYNCGAALASIIGRCADCGLCEKACPNKVPILELAKLVVDKSIYPNRSVQKAA